MKILLATALLLPLTAFAYGPYDIKVTRVLDGDTYDVIISTYPGQTNTERLRLSGVDTPELRAKTPCERKLAVQATEAASAFLQSNPTATFSKRGSFGRLLAKVESQGVDLGEYLISQGLAKKYVPKKNRKPWC